MVYYNCLCACFCFVIDLLFDLFQIAWWSPAGKELFTWFSAGVILDAVVGVGVLFPCVVLNRMWNSIVSVSDHCFFIHYAI